MQLRLQNRLDTLQEEFYKLEAGYTHFFGQ